MAYGVTSTTLLLAVGTNPAAASATVHLAEIGTTLASGLSHWKFGNVDWRVVLRVGVPGALGAFAGATVLSHLSTAVAAPVMSLILLTLGVYLLVRFTLRGIDRRHLGKPLRKRFLARWGSSPASSTPRVAAAGDRSAPRRCWPAAAWSRARSSAPSTPPSSSSRSPRAWASCSRWARRA